MEAAVFAARSVTFPEIAPNVSDPVWYGDIYSIKPHNDLDALSLSSNATDPTQEQVEKEAARTREALAEMLPPLERQANESKEYYANNFPRDFANDLDDFTWRRRTPAPPSPLDMPPSATALAFALEAAAPAAPAESAPAAAAQAAGMP